MKQSTKRKIILTIQKNLPWLILLICMIAFFAIMEDVLKNEIWKFDDKVYHTISNMISNSITSIFMIVTNLGGAIGIISITILILIFIKNRKDKHYILLNLVIVTISNQIIKYIVQRPRPVEHRIIEQFGYSFPSRTFNGKYGFLWIFNLYNL
ncbi:MAG: hypothetical protein HFJ27_02595 [Clostridia bacterium]|nr:hypothetical protein [Clostridia bacterium]